MYTLSELNEMDENRIKEIAGSMGLKKIDSIDKDTLVYHILDQQAIDAAASATEKKRRNQKPASKEPKQKKQPTQEEGSSATPAADAQPQPKKRGRKPKTAAPAAENAGAPQEQPQQDAATNEQQEEPQTTEQPQPKKRGRRRKNENSPEQPALPALTAETETASAPEQTEPQSLPGQLPAPAEAPAAELPASEAASQTEPTAEAEEKPAEEPRQDQPQQHGPRVFTPRNQQGQREFNTKDSSFGSADTVTVALADGLVPTGADGWPISVSELTQALQVDITYLGGVETSDPPQVLAVAIRVVPSEEPVEDTTNTVTDPQPVEPVPSEPEAEPFAPVELPAQDPVPAEIPYDGITLYGFQSIRTEIVRSGEADLDGCGTPETVQLLRIWDQYDQQSFVLRIQKGSDVFDTGFEEPDVSYPASFNAHIWLADLDADGYPEVYFNGNMNGDQYVLNVWSMKTGTPELIPFEDQIYLEAAIIGVSDNSLQLESTQNVLGSYSAIRAYALHDDVLTPLGDEWQIVPANTSYSRLSVVRDIPVTLDDGTESVFGPGTVLQVTGTDGKSFVDVITSDGVTGRIAIEQPAGDWQWYIDGESELEYFELVPYVG